MSGHKWLRDTHQWPEAGDFDQHYVTARQMRTIATYECTEAEGRIYISDPLWGREAIGDQPGDEVLVDLYRHPALQRLAAIEQLTLPKIYATMPGSFELTRWEHVWGSVVFTRKMLRAAEAEGRAFDDRGKLKFQLRTLLSDVGHTAFSHGGDWLKQGFGGPEDSHDLGLFQFLEDVGVNGVLRRHSIEPAEVIMPEGAEDFVECPSPDLCVDRVDYGCREIARWVDPNSEKDWLKQFFLDDQLRLVMSSKQSAARFALSYGLLATEHWGHPVHRLQLQLFAGLVKGAVLANPPMMRGNNLHPYDRLYTIDEDVAANIRASGTLNNDLHGLMLDIARSQRRIFSWSREQEIDHFLRGHLGDTQTKGEAFLHPLEAIIWVSKYTGVKPREIELIRVGSAEEVPDFGATPHTFDVFLPPLKPRAVDPLYQAEDGTTRRLSDDPQFKALISQHKQIQGQAYVARIYMSPDAATKLKTGVRSVQKQWDKAVKMERPADSADTLRDRIELIGGLALTRAPYPILYRK
jgi:hypothetical protein